MYLCCLLEVLFPYETSCGLTICPFIGLQSPNPNKTNPNNYRFLPETKDKSIAELDGMFRGNKTPSKSPPRMPE